MRGEQFQASSQKTARTRHGNPCQQHAAHDPDAQCSAEKKKRFLSGTLMTIALVFA